MHGEYIRGRNRKNAHLNKKKKIYIYRSNVNQQILVLSCGNLLSNGIYPDIQWLFANQGPRVVQGVVTGLGADHGSWLFDGDCLYQWRVCRTVSVLLSRRDKAADRATDGGVGTRKLKNRETSLKKQQKVFSPTPFEILVRKNVLIWYHHGIFFLQPVIGKTSIVRRDFPCPTNDNFNNSQRLKPLLFFACKEADKF